MRMAKKNKNKQSTSDKPKTKAKKKQVLKIIPPVVAENALPAVEVDPIAVAKGSVWSWVKPVLLGTCLTAAILVIVVGGIFFSASDFFYFLLSVIKDNDRCPASRSWVAA